MLMIRMYRWEPMARDTQIPRGCTLPFGLYFNIANQLWYDTSEDRFRIETSNGMVVWSED